MHLFIKLFLLLLHLYCAQLSAQPFLLKSVPKDPSFSLKIYYGSKGKGAFVQYSGQKGIIPLEVKSYLRGSANSHNGQQGEDVLVWNELVNGKISGTYSLREGLRYVTDAWYQRSRDNRRFELKEQQQKGKYDGVDKYLLHGTLVEFNHYYNDTLIFRYPDKTVSALILPEIMQPGGARQSHIADYNFDGYDDLAFSVADAGMGVYQQFIIYLYHPQYRQFYPMDEPDYSDKANCSCLCNVSIDEEKKELRTSCRGGARWWQDVWRFQNRKLVWVRSDAEPVTNE